MKAKKIISITLILTILLSLFPQMIISTSAADGVLYYSYNTETKDFDEKYCTDSEIVTDKTGGGYLTRWEKGKWYVVEGTTAISNDVIVKGDAKLILTKGSHLTVNGNINVEEGSKLTIYSQTKEIYAAENGLLETQGKDNCAGIGGGAFGDCGDIIIHGGRLNVTGGEDAAGIGGGNDGDGGNVTIYGGYIRATGADGAPGIGSGYSTFKYSRDAGKLSLYGGDVTAVGGDYAAGVGGSSHNDGGEVTIYDGYLFASAGFGGAGIGGGYGDDGGKYVQHGGKVAARGNGGAGIGGGYEGEGDYFAFYGGIIKASNNASEFEGKKLAVGSGINGGDVGHLFFGENLIYFNNNTNEIVENSYDVNWKSFFTNNYSIDITAKTCKDFPVSYVERGTDGTEKTKICTDYIPLHNDVNTWGDGWYVMTDSGTAPTNIAVTGDANLILTNGCSFNVDGSIIVNENASLSIYCQPEGEEPEGKLTVYGDPGRYFASIASLGGFIYIHGGEIEARGRSYCSGIGGTYAGDDSYIRVEIYGGNITAVGGGGAAGIGGCYGKSGISLRLYGGSITAEGTEYWNETPRAIGAGNGITDNGKIVIANGLELIDNTTGEFIDRGFGETPWESYFKRTSVSFTVTSDDPDRESVSYRFYNTETGEFETGECKTYSVISGSSRILTDGWYVLDKSGTLANYLAVDGDVHIILKDGCTLTSSSDGIRVTEGNSLSIYAQSDSDNMGAISADASAGNFSSGIGAGSGQNGGTLTIHGGNITAQGGAYASGIGGGGFSADKTGSRGCDLTVYGGTVTALGGQYGAGIGGGLYGDGGNTKIYGGTVSAVGGCDGGAGIGGGHYNNKFKYDTETETVTACGNAGTFEIYGGTVDATGGCNSAGIGGGYGCNGGIIKVGGGTVIAVGGANAQGLGTGYFDLNDEHFPVKDGVVALYGGSVTSNGKELHVHSLALIPAIPATCTESGISTDYYVCEDENCKKFFADPESVTELTAETVAGFFLPTLSHSFTSDEYRDNGDGTHSRKCLRCDTYDTEKSAHADENSDLLCDFCGYDMCAHESTTDSYTWAEDYKVCRADRVCNTCGRAVLSELSVTVTFAEDTPGANCKEKGKGYYEAAFNSFESIKTDSIFDTDFGPHIDFDGNSFCDSCGRFLRNDSHNVYFDTTTLTTGNWLVFTNRQFDEPIIIDGDVALYIMDGKCLGANKGIVVNEGSSLTVYAQSTDENNDAITAVGDLGAAGIGGSFGQNSGEIIINSGKVTATGSIGAAGIGGGFNGSNGKVTINGGNVTATAGVGATAGTGGSGIGGGYNGTDGTIEINNVKKLKAVGFRGIGAGQEKANTGLTTVAKCLTIKSGADESSAKKSPIITEEAYIEITPYVEPVIFETMSLTLDGSIGVNFYVQINDMNYVGDNAYMTMEFDNFGEKMTKVVDLKDAEDLGNGKYKFTFYVNSLQMAEDINATFYYGDGEFIAHTTSVKAYAEALVDGSKNPKSVELAKAILAYGYYAQLALQETHKFTLGADGKYDAMPTPENTPDTSIDLSEYALKLGGSNDNITALSMSLALDKKTDIYIYVTTDTEPTVTGADVEIEKVGERYRITIPNIAAHELADTYSLNIDGLTVDVSAFSYINSVLKSTSRSTNYKKAVAALYEYYTAAVAYAK